MLRPSGPRHLRARRARQKGEEGGGRRCARSRLSLTSDETATSIRQKGSTCSVFASFGSPGVKLLCVKPHRVRRSCLAGRESCESGLLSGGLFHGPGLGRECLAPGAIYPQLPITSLIGSKRKCSSPPLVPIISLSGYSLTSRSRLLLWGQIPDHVVRAIQEKWRPGNTSPGASTLSTNGTA